MDERLVLLVDNDEDFLNTTKEFLEQHGYCVRAVSTPTVARQALAKEPVALAILDVRLLDDQGEWDKSGINLAKETAWDQSVPKIMISALESVENVRQALKVMPGGPAPAVDFILKTDSLEVLLEAVQAALTIDVARLRDRIVERFSEGELRDLYFDLGVDYENLGGERKADKARELVVHFERRSRLPVLVEGCRRRRPNLPWH
ncbi:MAG: response regulator [Chloroflexi bacterium]|nr:response regulator [Chloroflexota bacterium]MCI0581155.1 response regulator [Chloroflexota bacterium]MCI0645375.1 response regulator [Chloroflexota bacterium]MCI0727194.1 response regulator [Chloroflexota bacterium]